MDEAAAVLCRSHRQADRTFGRNRPVRIAARGVDDKARGSLGELARHLNAAWSHRTRSHTTTAINLASPWADNWAEESRRQQQDAMTATTALHLLLQQALLTPPAGHRPVDVLAVAELVALAEVVLATGDTAVAAGRRLHDLVLTIDPSGLFTLSVDPDPGTPAPAQTAAPGVHLGFDAGAYHYARHERMIATAADTKLEAIDAAGVLARPNVRTPVAFRAAAIPAGSELAKADQLLIQHWGCSLDTIVAVLATAIDWPTGESGISP